MNNQVPCIYPWQVDAWDSLQKKMAMQRLPHALLLQGKIGCGLEAFSHIFANALLCDQNSDGQSKPTDGLACGVCQSCQLFQAGTHPDFIELVPEANKEGKVSKIIKVDQVRRLVDFVSKTAMQGAGKVIVINPADAMNINAANAVLKCLEEPGENTQFLLLSFQANKIMPTVRSRCQKINLAAPDTSQADKWLSTFVDDTEARKNLLAMSANSPLLALKWYEDASIERMRNMQNDLMAVLSQGMSPVVMAKSWFKQESGLLLQWWWRWLALEVKKQVKQQNGLLGHYALSEKQILSFMLVLQTAKKQLESTANPNEQLLLESLLIDWQSLPSV